MSTHSDTKLETFGKESCNMKFIPDHSCIVDNGSKNYYYERLNKVRDMFVNKPDRIETLRDYITLFRNEIACMTFGLTKASKYYGKVNEFNKLIKQMWSLVHMMTLPEDFNTSDNSIDVNMIEKVLRTGHDLAYKTCFKGTLPTINMPVYIRGMKTTFESTMTTLNMIKNNMNDIVELLDEFVNQETELTAA